MNRKYLRNAVAVASACVILFGTTGCLNKALQSHNDSPRDGNDKTPALVVAFPDGFGNVATKCVPGTDVRITVLFHNNGSYGSVSTVVDPECK